MIRWKKALPLPIRKTGGTILKKVVNRSRMLAVPTKIQIIRELELIDNSIIVVCVVRNGMDYVQKFLEHHRAIGVKQFVFLLNCTTDDTREYLLTQHDTTLLESDANYAYYENQFKKYLITKYCKSRWCLFLDIDELFIYPGYPSSDSLQKIMQYSENNNYNAVVTQMLDMFANSDTNWHSMDDQIYYDISDIVSENYTDRQKVTNDYPPEFFDGSIQFHSNGIRKILFGSNNGLTKISFFKYTHPMKLFVHEHHCSNSRLANFSCGLLHYPFSKSFVQKVEDAVHTQRYGKITSVEYELYNLGIGESNQIAFTKLDPVELLDTRDLYKNGFLYAPPGLQEVALQPTTQTQ